MLARRNFNFNQHTFRNRNAGFMEQVLRLFLMHRK